ncbi:MAG: sortase [Raoultibacter sp.]
MKWGVAGGVVFLAINAVLLFFSVINPITFTQLAQNPEATMAKYEHVWNDATVHESPYQAKSYAVGDVVGTVTIPKLEIYEMPIYYGTTDENKNWQITTPGYGGNWQLFGEKGLAALGAHNYQLFSQLETLGVGEKIIVETTDDIYVYVVQEAGVYDHTKQSWEDAVYTGKALYAIDLLTCYPADALNTEDRYVVYATLQKGTIFVE